ncbi:MAG: Methyltransferase type 11 [Parcubacteria group bacterium GW2011_GWA2_49_9]|nr:MAG: Methyltransferase type 11 [Parcubacteria group bacterium GW2011_GWA2_49_9]
MTCVICGSTKQSVIRDTLRYGVKRDVLRCSKCGLVFLASQKGTDTYYAGKEYRKRHGPTPGKASSMREIFDAYFPHQGPIVKALKNHLRPGMSVLDVGCSTGHFLAALKGKVKTRVGLELGQDEAAFIRKNLDFKVYTEPIESARIDEGPFDLVTAFQVLEHIPEPVSFLRGIAKNLKPNGLLYLELPNIDDALLSVFKVKGYADFYYREPHVSYYSKNTLMALLRKTGFNGEVKTVQRYNFTNQMRWILTGKPQTTFAQGNGTPVLVTDESVPSRIRASLNVFFKDADIRYRKLIEQNGAGDNLTFLGRKTL